VRVLLDESVPVQVRRALPDHSVSTTVEMGWRGISNGELLNRAEAEGFELVIVADKNLRHQRNLTKRSIAILELWTNHRPTLEQHFVRIRDRVQSATSGQYIVLEREDK
jgi:predicted nuclease of predicted toxin-antitoxin system